MSGHTAWEIFPGANSYFFEGRVVAGDQCVAFVDVDVEHDEAGEIFLITPSPEARLIAAAPDLLEALRTMVYETTHLSPMEPNGAHKCIISGEALAKARAALTKATGGAA